MVGSDIILCLHKPSPPACIDHCYHPGGHRASGDSSAPEHSAVGNRDGHYDGRYCCWRTRPGLDPEKIIFQKLDPAADAVGAYYPTPTLPLENSKPGFL